MNYINTEQLFFIEEKLLFSLIDSSIFSPIVVEGIKLKDVNLYKKIGVFIKKRAQTKNKKNSSTVQFNLYEQEQDILFLFSRFLEKYYIINTKQALDEKTIFSLKQLVLYSCLAIDEGEQKSIIECVEAIACQKKINLSKKTNIINHVVYQLFDFNYRAFYANKKENPLINNYDVHLFLNSLNDYSIDAKSEHITQHIAQLLINVLPEHFISIFDFIEKNNTLKKNNPICDIVKNCAMYQKMLFDKNLDHQEQKTSLLKI